jgi:trehalose 2-sulfotransferase
MDRLAILDELDELDLMEMLRGRRKWCFVADPAFHARLRALLPAEEQRRLLRLSEVPALTAGHFEGFEVAVICTNGSEDLPRETLAKRFGLRPLRLFADLVPRRAAGLPLRAPAPPPDAPPPDLAYAILCLPRCGSTLLAKELELAGLGEPKEHLRGPLATLLRHRDASGFSLERWWALVRAGATQDGVFGTKIIFDFLAMASDEMDERERGWFLDRMREMRVVRILRRNKVDQAVSDHVARKTGVWHLWNEGIRAGYGERIDAVTGDLGELSALHRKFVRNEERLDRMLRDGGIEPIDLEYDDLAARPKETVAALVRRLGRAVPEGYLDGPVTLEPTRTPVHARLAAQLAASLG